MNGTATLLGSISELTDVLVRIVTSPGVTWDTVAAAADLIALDVRFDNWFLTVAKPSMGAEELENILDLSERMTDLVRRTWDAYEGSPDDAKGLRDALADASRAFRAVITTVQSSDP